MKKQIKLIAVAFLLSLTAFTSVNAQIAFKKSDKFVEGTASYSKSEGTDASYSLAPTVGYFISDRFAAGVFGQVGKDGDGVETSTIGAFGRCYVLNIGKNLTTYSQLNVGSSSVNDAGTKTSALGINLGLGANYFVSPKLALSMHISDLMNYTSVESSSSFSIGWEGVNNPFSMTKFGLLYRF